jgi:Pentapeptide repeats (8 copies)
MSTPEIAARQSRAKNADPKITDRIARQLGRAREWVIFQSRRRRVQQMTLLLSLVLVLIAAGWLLLQAPPWLVDRSTGTAQPLSGLDRAKAVTEERRTVLALFAGIAGAVTLWFTAQRQQLDRDANRTDRYAKAVEQLGDDAKPAVQLGGVYALERVALDSLRDRAAACDVLSAFVRQQAVKPMRDSPLPGEESGDSSEQKGEATAIAEPVAAACTVLARQPIRDPTYPRPDLRDAYLAGVELSNANLSDAILYGTNLSDANLNRADLSDAKLEGADLSDAYLNRANLNRANLAKANLRRAYLYGANLSHANLSGADLGDARLDGADLSHADLRGAVLIGANLYRVNLSDAKLEGANLDRVRGVPREKLRALMVRTK